MLPSLVIEMPSISTGWPLWRMVYVGGSSKPRLTVAMSPSLMVRPPAAIGTWRMSSTFANWPLTRTITRSPRVSIWPAGSMAFWLFRLSAMANGVMPSAARRSCENSTYTFSACLPIRSTFLTIGTLSRRRLMFSAASDSSAWPMPSPLTA